MQAMCPLTSRRVHAQDQDVLISTLGTLGFFPKEIRLMIYDCVRNNAAVSYKLLGGLSCFYSAPDNVSRGSDIERLAATCKWLRSECAAFARGPKPLRLNFDILDVPSQIEVLSSYSEIGDTLKRWGKRGSASTPIRVCIKDKTSSNFGIDVMHIFCFFPGPYRDRFSFLIQIPAGTTLSQVDLNETISSMRTLMRCLRVHHCPCQVTLWSDIKDAAFVAEWQKLQGQCFQCVCRTGVRLISLQMRSMLHIRDSSELGKGQSTRLGWDCGDGIS
ncbi:hypothetical protein ANO11243_051370 [Dothideomycetidae sp. 11243]|nr:hypothetical protein ANO11243_051370 [fungal sp. No.11243]